MKKILSAIACFLILQSCMGGIGIPFGNSLYSRNVMGEKRDCTGSIVSYVEKREIKEEWYHFASVEGPGRHRVFHTKYFLVEGKKSFDLEFIKFDLHDGSLKSRDYIEYFLPSVASGHWITFRQLDARKGSYDIEMVIFNREKVLKNEVVLNCERKCPFAEALEDYGIYPDLENGKILFRTLDGIVTFDLNNTTLS